MQRSSANSPLTLFGRRCKWTGQTSQQRFAAVTTVVSEPFDHLLMQVQKESESGGFLLRLPSGQNRFAEAQQAFADMLLQPIQDTSLHYLFHFHGGGDLEGLHTLGSQVFCMALAMSAESWYRCEVFFDRYPVKLVRLVDPTATDEERAAAIQDLFSTEPCCLDPHFTRKVLTHLLLHMKVYPIQ